MLFYLNGHKLFNYHNYCKNVTFNLRRRKPLIAIFSNYSSMFTMDLEVNSKELKNPVAKHSP